MVKAHAQPCFCQPLVAGVGEGKTAWQDDRGDPKGWFAQREGMGCGCSDLLSQGLPPLPLPPTFTLLSFSLIRQSP